MKKHIRSLALSVMVMILMYPSLISAEETGRVGVYHIVICWLKEPGDQMQRQKLIEGTKRLRSIPGVLSIEIGDMLPSKRAIVDSSFDLGIVMGFADRDAMNVYLQDPRHQKATKELLAPLTSRAIIYDLVMQE